MQPSECWHLMRHLCLSWAALLFGGEWLHAVGRAYSTAPFISELGAYGWANESHPKSVYRAWKTSWGGDICIAYF